MSITYGIVTETHEVNAHKRTSYGIAAYSNVEENGAACVLYAARDLSQTREPIEPLVAQLNSGEASALHFEDLINDFLAIN